MRRRVAGIAMGLVLAEDGGCVVLSDILGIEDALGDMDFKVAGDEDAITAFQMDIKVEGVTVDILREALAAAREGRRHILGEMAAARPPPREGLSAHCERLLSVDIQEDKIGLLIGPGGARRAPVPGPHAGWAEKNRKSDGSPSDVLQARTSASSSSASTSRISTSTRAAAAARPRRRRARGAAGRKRRSRRTPQTAPARRRW